MKSNTTRIKQSALIISTALIAQSAWASGYHFGTQSVSSQSTANSSAAEAADPTPAFDPAANRPGIRDIALAGHAFVFEAKGSAGAQAVVLFHRKDAGFIPNSRIEFILPVKPETLQLPADCDGIRVLAAPELEIKCTAR